VELTFQMTRLFVDRPAIKAAIQKGEKQAMVKQLAFIRRRAISRQVLRRRKRVSKPGEPPSIHTSGPISLKKIFFVYFPMNHTGIVGPVKFNRRHPATQHATALPGTLEHGGTYKQLEWFVQPFRGGGFWTRVDYRRLNKVQRDPRTRRRTRMRRITIKPRPFMAKALRLEIEAGTIMEPWSGVIIGNGVKFDGQVG
jgi:hypothetical protein